MAGPERPDGVDTPGKWLPARQHARLITLAELRAGVTPASLSATVTAAAAFADQAIEALVATYSPRIDCREGCWYCCCSPHILVSVPELLHIVDVVTRTFSAADLMALRARARDYAAHNRGRSLEELAESLPPACPLLVDQRCSVYGSRPLTCRAYASMDVEACRKDYERAEGNVPLFTGALMAANAVLSGSVEALAESGINGALVDLGCSLHVALEFQGDLFEELRNPGTALVNG